MFVFLFLMIYLIYLFCFRFFDTVLKKICSDLIEHFYSFFLGKRDQGDSVNRLQYFVNLPILDCNRVIQALESITVDDFSIDQEASVVDGVRPAASQQIEDFENEDVDETLIITLDSSSSVGAVVNENQDVVNENQVSNQQGGLATDEDLSSSSSSANKQAKKIEIDLLANEYREARQATADMIAQEISSMKDQCESAKKQVMAEEEYDEEETQQQRGTQQQKTTRPLSSRLLCSDSMDEDDELTLEEQNNIVVGIKRPDNTFTCYFDVIAQCLYDQVNFRRGVIEDYKKLAKVDEGKLSLVILLGRLFVWFQEEEKGVLGNTKEKYEHQLDGRKISDLALYSGAEFQEEGASFVPLVYENGDVSELFAFITQAKSMEALCNDTFQFELNVERKCWNDDDNNELSLTNNNLERFTHLILPIPTQEEEDQQVALITDLLHAFFQVEILNASEIKHKHGTVTTKWNSFPKVLVLCLHRTKSVPLKRTRKGKTTPVSVKVVKTIFSFYSLLLVIFFVIFCRL